MDDGKGTIVVKLDKRPITYRRKIYARLNRVNKTSCQFSKNFAVVISYEVAVLMDRSHASHGAVWSQRLRPFVFKPLIKSERYKFHIKLIAAAEPQPRRGVSVPNSWFSGRVAAEALAGSWSGYYFLNSSFFSKSASLFHLHLWTGAGSNELIRVHHVDSAMLLHPCAHYEPPRTKASTRSWSWH
jgi:hypothetical protein